MSAKNLRKMVVWSVVLVCISAGFVQADKLELQEKLSKEVKIRLNDVTIAEALEKIGQKAEVKFVLSDEAVWKLPYGKATRLSVALDGPLAESMMEMLNAFFMRYAIGGEEITIYPRPELKHILGKPTAKQLELLKRIYTLRIAFSHEANPNEVAGLINKSLGPEGLVVSPVQYYLEFAEVLKTLAGEQAVAVTLAQLFDSVRRVWYLSGIDFDNQTPEIRIVSTTEFRIARLDQIVDISFKEEKAEVIIQRLANWTGMELLVTKDDPSWLQEEISVDMQDIKLRQAIVNIVTTVDGQVSIRLSDNTIQIRGPIHKSPRGNRRTSRRPASSDRAGSDSYVGKISIPMDGGKYYVEFMLRESDLTEQLKKLREEKMVEILGRAPSPKPKLTPAAAPKK
ncbi:MAG: hypothetical protein ACYS1A_09030 [Planctomycetota bacterium]